jgi:hypothetical protein
MNFLLRLLRRFTVEEISMDNWHRRKRTSAHRVSHRTRRKMLRRIASEMKKLPEISPQ